MTEPEEEHEKTLKTDAVLHTPRTANPGRVKKEQPKATVDVDWNEGEPVEPRITPREER
ncbi:hypothetical protein GCM10027290_27850 [Micromonospora sonneratiae]|uniref:Uncharacterized protein n=1 Tax=Micromonospora sonneratiae TaxID=1184706 RepID=A0ABW3YBM5_9ACTN